MSDESDLVADDLVPDDLVAVDDFVAEAEDLVLDDLIAVHIFFFIGNSIFGSQPEILVKS